MTSPAPQAVPEQKFSIPGLSYSGTSSANPYILVIGQAKTGKSTTVLSLFDWPKPGMRPLVIAADPTGPDSCSKFGAVVPVLKIRDMPGSRFTDKSKHAVDLLEKEIVDAKNKPNALVIDCLSTWVERLLADDARYSKNPDPRSHYRVAGDVMRDLLNRMLDFGVPVIGLAWLEEGGTEVIELPNGQKGRRSFLGGPSIMGRKMRAQIAGKADMILLLEKAKVRPDTPGADSEGYIRQFRTKTYDNIECGGRYTLPDPCPVHLGYILDSVMGNTR